MDVPEDQPTSDAPTEATSEEPTETPEVVQEPTEETSPEESGDILRTEATEEQDEGAGNDRIAEAEVAPQPPDAQRAAEEPADTSETASAEPSEAAEDPLADLLDEAAGAETAEAGGSDVVAPTGPPLSAGEIGDVRSAIGNKWNLGNVSTDAMRTTVVVRVTFDQSGKPGNIELIESDGPTQQATDTAFSAARRAIIRAYQEGGIPLPPDKYETWKVLEFVFDPNGMRLR